MCERVRDREVRAKVASMSVFVCQPYRLLIHLKRVKSNPFALLLYLQFTENKIGVFMCQSHIYYNFWPFHISQFYLFSRFHSKNKTILSIMNLIKYTFYVRIIKLKKSAEREREREKNTPQKCGFLFGVSHAMTNVPTTWHDIGNRDRKWRTKIKIKQNRTKCYVTNHTYNNE